MKVVRVRSIGEQIQKARKLILSAGNRVAGVHFVKRSDGSRRRMVCRLHVQHPQYAAEPNGRGKGHLKIDRKNHQMVVFDVNKIRYNRQGDMNGRGDSWTVPLDAVTRVAVNGVIYKIVKV